MQEGIRNHDEKIDQLAVGDDPEMVGRCVAVTFVVENKGSKSHGRIVRRREFETGMEAKTVCQAEEKELQKQYAAQVGTLYLNAPGPSNFIIEQDIRQLVRDMDSR